MTYTIAEHIAMEGVAPFELADEVALPSGARLRGSIARVYSLLRGTVDLGMAHRIGAKVGPAGWVPGYYIRKAWSGGNAGDRRLRDLREKGVEIVHQRFGEGSEEESNTYLYRWVSDPEPGTAIRTPEASHRKPPTGSTLANGQFSGPSATLRTPPVSPTPRFHPVHGRLTFFTCVGNPGSGAPGPINLAPHFRHCLAPSVRMMAGAVRGEIAGETAAAAYREELATQWAQGDLRFWLEENLGKVLTLWTPPECAAAFDPLPLVAAILVKCGAEHLGDWQQGAKRGVA
ncbi:MAG: hypothetical protein NUV72_08525 [Bauldia sp.]|nr:hypothetical protein [Bauldia sp.]